MYSRVFWQTDQQTHRPTNLLIEAPFPKLKHLYKTCLCQTDRRTCQHGNCHIKYFILLTFRTLFNCWKLKENTTRVFQQVLSSYLQSQIIIELLSSFTKLFLHLIIKPAYNSIRFIKKGNKLQLSWAKLSKARIALN